jgi:hypothetical protein
LVAAVLGADGAWVLGLGDWTASSAVRENGTNCELIFYSPLKNCCHNKLIILPEENTPGELPGI